MGVSFPNSHDRGVRFTFGELTGAVGDSVTVFPLVIALGTLTDASLAHVLLGFGAFQVVWGFRYGLPLSVEPMKALVGLAIAGTLTYGELVAAGLLAGGVLLLAGSAGLIGRVRAAVGRPVVRGVQLGVALLLAGAGLDLAAADPVVAVAGLGVALLAAVVERRLAALAVLAAGTAVALRAGTPTVSFPALSVLPAGDPSLTRGALSGLAAQLAMTVGNAAVATSLLLEDLYGADVSADELSRSMGVTNLLAVPLGGAPMCHGSGGLAGKHAFGARTGGANVVLGIGYAGAALVAGLWTGFPTAALGVLLLVVAAGLGRVAFGDVSGVDRALVLGIGGFSVLVSVGVAFLAGAGAWWFLERIRT
ncbi:MAG: putative sulfate/molybdate transporter [Haloarculaceae archaeon]